MKTISVINMKGGVGKSTIAVNTAFWLARSKKRTLLVDIDPQFNATQYALGVDRTRKYLSAKERSVADIFENPSIGDSEKLIQNVCPCLDIVPSTLELNKVLKNPAQKEQRLFKFLKKRSDDYDYVIIDCPPTDSMLTIAAYLSSDFLVIPVRLEFFSVVGLPLLLQSYNDFIGEYCDSKLKIAGIVINRPRDQNSETSTSETDIITFASQNSIKLFSTPIKFSKSYLDGSRQGKPIFETPHARESNKMNFEAFANELLDCQC